MAKFGGALSNLAEARAKKAPVEKPVPEATPEAPEPEKAEPKTAVKTRGVGRPKGRASNPDYTTTTILINKKLRADVVAEIALQKTEAPLTPAAADLSDVIEKVLREWLNRQYAFREKQEADRKLYGFHK